MNQDNNIHKFVPSAEYHCIPWKYNPFITQEYGGYFAILPSIILPIIKEYLRQYDFVQLLNTNLSLFQLYKFENIKYKIVHPATKFSKNGSELERVVTFPTGFIEKGVKNKSQQISVYLLGPNTSLLQQMDGIYCGVSKLSLHGYYARWNEINLKSCFNNISHLILQNVETIKIFPEGLENVEILELTNWRYLKNIDALSGIPTLKKLILEKCPHIEDIRAVANVIPKFKFQSNYSTPSGNDIVGLHQTHLSFNCFSVSESGIRLENLTSLQELTLGGNFSNELLLLSCMMLKNIPVLQLAQIPSNESRRTILPFFLARKQMILSGFNLKKWNENLFPSNQLEEIQNSTLIYLKLKSCTIDSSIPSIPSLQFLKMIDINGFISMPYFPVLQSCFLSKCEQRIQNFDNISNIYYLKLAQMKVNYNLSTFHNLKKIHFIDCSESCDFHQLSSTCKEILLSNCPNQENFSFTESNSSDHHRLPLRLFLNGMNSFINGLPFQQIQFLFLSRCNKLIDTNYLSHLKVLHIADCYYLKNLIQLQNIHIIIIENCPNIMDYSGIGNNYSVTISSSTIVDRMYYHDYLKKGLWKEIFDSIRYFRIIPSTTAKGGEGGESRSDGWNFLSSIQKDPIPLPHKMEFRDI
jgi:hypothetical protein